MLASGTSKGLPQLVERRVYVEHQPGPQYLSSTYPDLDFRFRFKPTVRARVRVRVRVRVSAGFRVTHSFIIII